MGDRTYSLVAKSPTVAFLIGNFAWAWLLHHLSGTASAILGPAATNEGRLRVLAAGIGAALVWLVVLALLVGRRRDFEVPSLLYAMAQIVPNL